MIYWMVVPQVEKELIEHLTEKKQEASRVV